MGCTFGAPIFSAMRSESVWSTAAKTDTGTRVNASQFTNDVAEGIEELTLPRLDLGALRALHMDGDVVHEVFAVGVAEHLLPERAWLLEVDCNRQNEYQYHIGDHIIQKTTHAQ